MQGAEPEERPQTDKTSPHSYPDPAGSWGSWGGGWGGAHHKDGLEWGFSTSARCIFEAVSSSL